MRRLFGIWHTMVSSWVNYGQLLDNITSCEQEKGLKKKTLNARTLNSTTNVVANEGFTSAN